MTRSELLAAIYANPADDMPRLKFADFLTEHGDPLGEFIRLQVQLARQSDSPSRGKWREECQQLLDTYHGEWLKDAPQQNQCRYDFQRGFIEMATVDARCWLEHAGNIMQIAPLLRDLRLLEPQSCFHELVRNGEFGQIDSLRLTHSQLQASQVIQLLESGRVPPLRELRLPFNNISNQVVPVFNADVFRRLEMLDLQDNLLSHEAAVALASSTGATRLHTLLLRGNGLGAEGFTSLMGAKNMEQLTTLHVSDNHIRGHFSFPPRVAGMLPALKWLSLDENRLRPPGILRLSQNGYFAGLWHLSLRCNGVGDVGAAAIAANPLHSQLRRLDLRSNQITGVGIAHLARSEHLQNLRQLDLSSNVFTFRRGRALLDADVFPHMEKLTLTGNPLTPSAHEQLRSRYGDRLVYEPGNENGFA